MIEVDQIVSGVGVEGRLARRRSPARRGVGEVDPLRLDRRGSAEGSIIEDLKILSDRTTGTFGRETFFPRNRALAVDIGADQARIDREAFCSHQSFSHAALHRHLEELAQQVAVAEPAVSVLGEGGVIGHRPLEIEPAEPAIGEVEVHLLAQAALRAYAHAIANEEHPDH